MSQNDEINSEEYVPATHLDQRTSQDPHEILPDTVLNLYVQQRNLQTKKISNYHDEFAATVVDEIHALQNVFNHVLEVNQATLFDTCATPDEVFLSIAEIDQQDFVSDMDNKLHHVNVHKDTQQQAI